ncbi:MAG: Rrf2 family transcriptional regulator [Dechloromonas sp.]|jgi:Rrf2 family nitric oxide-sensitive transcriptional repressor|nr:Rrf2 family transcriptional regulator [Dechloromonas sp.]
MRLTAFTDYTLRVLMYLALHPGRLATIPEMARAYGISENHLMKVVHKLARDGLIESLRGKGGGVRLMRAPGDIRLGTLVRASEGEAAIVECFSSDASACRIAPSCRLAGILGIAFEQLYATLDTYTLADLVVNERELVRLFPDAARTAGAAA